MSPLGKKRMKQVAIGAAIILGVAFVAEKVSDWLLAKNFDHKASYVQSGTIDADVLIQGPSRAVHMLDATLVQKRWGRSVYNLAVNGSHVDEQLTLLRLYLRHHDAPKVIFYEHAANYLGSPPGENQTAFYHSYMFVQAMSDPAVRADVRAHDATLFWAWYVPSLKYGLYNSELTNLIGRGAIQAVRGSREVNFVRGYQPLDRPWDGKFDEFKKMFPDGRRFEIDPDRVRALDEYLRFCRERGIEVRLYQAPILQEALGYFTNQDELERTMRDIAKRNDVPWVTFYDLDINRDRALFYNSTHLNREGSTRFSEIFATRMRPWLDATPQ